MARRERNICKRKDGRYEARFIKDRDAQGKAIYGVKCLLADWVSSPVVLERRV